MVGPKVSRVAASRQWLILRKVPRDRVPFTVTEKISWAARRSGKTKPGRRCQVRRSCTGPPGPVRTIVKPVINDRMITEALRVSTCMAPFSGVNKDAAERSAVVKRATNGDVSGRSTRSVGPLPMMPQSFVRCPSMTTIS